MNQSFFIGAVGAHQQLRHLNVQGNNIANVNTYGFKAERGRFASLMHTDIRAIGDRQLPVGTLHRSPYGCEEGHIACHQQQGAHADGPASTLCRRRRVTLPGYCTMPVSVLHKNGLLTAVWYGPIVGMLQ